MKSFDGKKTGNYGATPPLLCTLIRAFLHGGNNYILRMNGSETSSDSHTALIFLKYESQMLRFATKNLSDFTLFTN